MTLKRPMNRDEVGVLGALRYDVRVDK